MTPLGKTLIVLEIVAYGLSLNLGHPFDTLVAAIVATALVASTWAIDSVIRHLRRFRKP